MITDSPFILGRFEYTSQHLYFLPKDIFAVLENPKPTQLIGTRGTGKTTLLKALNWSERQTNSTLKRALLNEPFADRYIGVYFKLPDTQFQSIDSWLKGASETQRASILGTYFDLLWLELLMDAMADLVADGGFKANIVLERCCVAELLLILEKLNDRTDIFPTASICTFKECASLFRRFRIYLERHALAGNPLADATSGIPLTQVGALGRSLAKPIACFCDKLNGNAGKSWHFKICVDEAEILTDFQMKLVNTIIRLAEAPVFYILSFVALPQYPTSTLYSDLTLSDADRQLIVLDEMTESSFKELTTGVANVRIQTRLENDNFVFDPKVSLGKLNINGLLQSILQLSVDPWAKKLLLDALEYGKTGVFGRQKKDDDGETHDSDIPPIYQAYLVQTLGLATPSSKRDWVRRKDDSSKFRKRIVAAYLSICANLKTDVRYASADMIMQMSDGCIRDFLAFMHDIYVEANMPLNEFLAREISSDVQNKAIKRTSKSKRASIVQRGVSAPTDTGRLIDALARITRIVQTEGLENQHLRACERGVFEISLRDYDLKKFERLLQLIADAGETGFLRVIEAEPSRWRFRVHKSLSPAYEFSYRGAYYTGKISPEELDSVVAISDSKKFVSCVKKIGQSMAGAMPPEAGAETDVKGDAPLFESFE